MKKQRTELFINNEWVKTGKTFQVFNPYDNELIAEMQEAGQAEIDAAMGAARKAFQEGPWSQMTGDERAVLIRRLANLINDRKE